MSLRWVALASRTGEIVADLIDLDPGSSGVTHTLSKYDTTTVQLPVIGNAKPPNNWLTATKPYASLIAALSDDEDETPLWVGLISQRVRAGNSRVQLSVSTLESYLQRRFIRSTLQYPQTDRLQIAADLANRYLLDGAGGRPSFPFDVEVDGYGLQVDGDYKDSDDRSLYSVFGDLGMEWTIGWRRQHLPERLTPVLYLSERIGQAADSDLGPAVTLDWPGNLVSAQIIEDYSDGKGANDVMLNSTGTGDVRPQSDHQAFVPADMPTVEYRQSAGQNITSRSTLNQYALLALQELYDGAVGYALTIAQNSPEAFMIGLGDDVGFDLSGAEFPEHPSGVLRAVGMQATNSTVSPVLAGESDDVGGS